MMDVDGARFGCRVVLGAAPKRWGKRMVRVRCDCGRISAVQLTKLLAGKCAGCNRCKGERVAAARERNARDPERTLPWERSSPVAG